MNWKRFSSFSNQVITGFDEKLKSFTSTASSIFDAEESDPDRRLILDLLTDDSIGLYHESYILFVLSRTYYDVSNKYLMPRRSGLSLMLAASNNDERRRLYKKSVSEKRAEINEVIDEQGADENELKQIEQGKKLLDY